MPLSGGDWAQINQDIIVLNDRLKDVEKWIVHRLRPDEVNDLKKRDEYEKQQIKVGDYINEINQIKFDAIQIKNKIESGYSSLQRSEKGGHLEQWQEKCAQIQSMISMIDQYIEAAEEYL